MPTTLWSDLALLVDAGEGKFVATLLICDDSPLTRETLRRASAALPDVRMVVTAASGEEALARWPVERPALVLMDVRMPGMGGVEAIRRLMATHTPALVVALVTADDQEDAARAIAAGARGYVVKEPLGEEFGAVVSDALAEYAAAGTRRQVVAGAGLAPALTERETQVLTGMSRGRSNAEIGRDLFLSEDTVKTHARRLFRKMHASDRAHAVAKGYRWGFVS